jgi:sugar phosphate isomerase/epimerase
MIKDLNRRSFLQSAAGSLLWPAAILARRSSKRLPLCFSTLGCPNWEWKTILEKAAESGYSALELRGVRGEMDLTKSPLFAGERLNQSLADLKALDLRIINLGASTKMHEPDPAKRRAQLDEARRFIELAQRLDSPYVRVFPDKYVAGEERPATIQRIAEGLRELGEFAKGSGVTVILEAHGDFTDSQSLLQIMQAAAMPSVALLWDAHHTFVAGKETPEQTFQHLSRYIRHVHLKDSKPAGNSVRYVLTGNGTVPIRKTVAVLVKGGYRGYYSFEWEKAWHPEIEEPEVAIPHFANVMSEYLTQAGFKA